MSSFQKNNSPINDPDLEKVKNPAVLINTGHFKSIFLDFFILLQQSVLHCKNCINKNWMKPLSSLCYENKLFRYSSLLKTARSSSFSPVPTKYIGILSFAEMLQAIPPFDDVSSFVSRIPSIPIY